jgi:hypothetical protein
MTIAPIMAIISVTFKERLNNMKIVVRKFAYLKKPLFSWWYEHGNGGGYSNSGMLPSLNKCLASARYMNKERLGIPLEIYEIDGDGKETLIKKETL